MSKKKGDFQNKLIALGGEKSTRIKQNEAKSNIESSTLTTTTTITTRAKSSTTLTQQITQSLDPIKMKEELDKAMDVPLNDKLNKLIIPYINQLKQNLINNKQQNELPQYFITLTYLLLKRPQFFLKQSNIIEMIISLLKLFKDSKFSTNQQLQSIQFMCTFLNRLYSHEDFYHVDLFSKAFIDDWLGERIWCDNDLCREFVLNLISSFKTKQIPFSLESKVCI
jgi:integrator complex subunit 1